MKSATNKILEIQGLRALAATLVLVFHAKFISGGFVGVDIFYVISGFLITGLLLKELNSNGRISLKAFYLRRSKRLLPASFLVLFVTAIFAWLVLPPISRGSIGRDLIATTLYISNYLFSWWQNDYQNLNATPSPFIHYWSLAVEEQFYIFWPLFIIALAKLKSARKFLIGFSTATIITFALGVWLTIVAPIWAFYSLPTRAWELSIGALIALLPALRRQSRVLAIFGCIALVVSALWFNERTPFPGAYALLPVLGTAALLSSIGAWPQPLRWLATNPVSVWLGKISYPLYLWHWPVLVLPIALFARGLNLGERIAALIVTVVLADLTTRYVEEPLRIKNFAPRKVVLSTATAMVVALLVGFGIAQSTTSSILVNGKQVTLASIESRPTPYDDGCHLNYHESVSPRCEFGKLDNTKTVVLYGDSHAVQWFPALEKLANEKGFKLITLTKSACPSIDVVRESIGAFKMSNCAAWRQNAIARITEAKPDLIILSSFEHFVPPGDPRNVEQWWAEGSERTFQTLKPLTSKIVYLLDTPLPKRNIPDCLASTSADKCLANSKLGLPQLANFEIIDPAEWLCQFDCPGIVRGNVAYRDASHISVATSLELSDLLWQALIIKGFTL
ncbi:MAG: acyltransferase family protein [Actinobacteria bacterium]|nr:acyltransferase family protein [Actinomycetota bacterium]